MDYRPVTESELKFVQAVQDRLPEGQVKDRHWLNRLATEYNLVLSQTLEKELTELGIVRAARSLAQDSPNKSIRERFDSIVSLYRHQANLSMRSSTSMKLQQYSTPAPISYLASAYILKDNWQHLIKYPSEVLYFEPSAGNGLLTIALPLKHTAVNEIDDIRLGSLHTQAYAQITNQNAITPFIDHYHQYQGIVTNPPFGPLSPPLYYDGFEFHALDHVMALRALDTMTGDGRAAIIIGEHTTWDKYGRIKQGKNLMFFNYLYHHYHLDEMINIDGKKLYSRQGTAYDVRLILISGRKTVPEGFSPLTPEGSNPTVYTFDELFNRVYPLLLVKDTQGEYPAPVMDPKQRAIARLRQLKKQLDATSLTGLSEDLRAVTFYHGTPQGAFERFDLSRRGEGADQHSFGDYGNGAYFSRDREVAEGFARGLTDEGIGDNPYVVEARLDIKHPFDLRKLSAYHRCEMKLIRERGGVFKMSDEDWKQARKNAHLSNKELELMEDIEGDLSDNWGDWDIGEKLKNNGYDALISHDEQYVVFDPEKIRITGGYVPSEKEVESTLDGNVQTEILSVSDQYKGIPEKELTKLMYQYYGKHIQGRQIINRDTGIEISFTSLGKGKSTYGRKIGKQPILVNSHIATAIKNIIPLLEYAIFSGYVYRLKPIHYKQNGYRFWNFYAKLIIDGKLYLFSIPVLEKKNTMKFQYSIDYAIKKKILESKGSYSENELPSSQGLSLKEATKIQQ